MYSRSTSMAIRDLYDSVMPGWTKTTTPLACHLPPISPGAIAGAPPPSGCPRSSLHCELCTFFQCALWHSQLQYLTTSQPAHRLAAPSAPHCPHSRTLPPAAAADSCIPQLLLPAAIAPTTRITLVAPLLVSWVAGALAPVLVPRVAALLVVAPGEDVVALASQL